jgi:hypothetical protein
MWIDSKLWLDTVRKLYHFTDRQTDRQSQLFFLHFVDLHHVMILGKWPTWRTILYYVFIFVFNSLHVSSTSCSSSGETNCVSITSGNCHSVSVSVSCAGRKCTWYGHRHRVTVTRGSIDTICLSWWWARCARNIWRVKNKNKYIVKNFASRWSFTRSHNCVPSCYWWCVCLWSTHKSKRDVWP